MMQKLATDTLTVWLAGWKHVDEDEPGVDYRIEHTGEDTFNVVKHELGSEVDEASFRVEVQVSVDDTSDQE